METMSKFKVGDKIVVNARNNSLNNEIKIGDIRTVTETISDGVELDFISDGWVHDVDVELVPEIIKPKWTIYNNTLPWSQLSDKQKGKLLLAAHAKMLFCDFGLQIPGFALVNCVYRVEEVAKPEPTMAELFVIDIRTISLGGDWNTSDKMIAKGWTKPCK
jgi:hypothetical protein